VQLRFSVCESYRYDIIKNILAERIGQLLFLSKYSANASVDGPISLSLIRMNCTILKQRRTLGKMLVSQKCKMGRIGRCQMGQLIRPQLPTKLINFRERKNWYVQYRKRERAGGHKADRRDKCNLKCERIAEHPLQQEKI
jgi:hypothetical protein